MDKYSKDAPARKPQPKHKTHTLRFHVNIGENDRLRQIEKAKKFLLDRDQVKLFVQLRGREKSRPQVGLDLLKLIVEELDEHGTPMTEPRYDNLIITLSPKKQK